MEKVVEFFRLDYRQLQEMVSGLCLPKFVARQLCEWIFRKFELNPERWTNISQNNRKLLQSKISFGDLSVELLSKDDRDGTQKALFKTTDGLFFEGVLIPEKDHYTCCLSTQIGCRLSCAFCATAQAGFRRNLEYSEIIEQLVRLSALKEDRKRRTNVVFMGMGEPLLNYSNLRRALQIMLDENCLGISPRHITVSTAGIFEEIVQLEKDFPRLKLALSLNAPQEKLRAELMPIENRQKLKKILDYFRQTRRKNRITVEYVMLAGINDSIQQAEMLADLLRGIDCKINLIPFNQHSFSKFSSPSLDIVEQFQQFLLDRNYTVNVRFSKGQNIASACGQLVALGGRT